MTNKLTIVMILKDVHMGIAIGFQSIIINGILCVSASIGCIGDSLCGRGGSLKTCL